MNRDVGIYDNKIQTSVNMTFDLFCFFMIRSLILNHVHYFILPIPKTLCLIFLGFTSEPLIDFTNAYSRPITLKSIYVDP